MKRSFLLIILFFSCLPAFSQLPTNGVERKLQIQRELYPQEKLHLHLDKSMYLSGEKIWFRAYLVDAASHLPVANSRYVYAELIADNDSIVNRVMIRPDSLDHYYGYLQIPEHTQAGEYNIRAYTAYMRNKEDYFFQKNIYILSHIKQKLEKKYSGTAFDYDIQFFPEGGRLPQGIVHKIAFKAIGKDGLHRNISGYILDEKQDTLTSFASTHLGMGYFMLKALPGKQYYAECINEFGDKKRFKLPEAENTVALKVERSRGKIVISVSESEALSYPKDSLFVLIHTRGYMQYWGRWKAEQDYLILNSESFPSGVSQITLLDPAGNVLSERLIFCLNKDQATVSVFADKPVYEKREKIVLDICLDDARGVEEKGSFSVAVTDDRDLLPDTTSSILSDLLLTSELKGYIEYPSYYLQPENRQAINAADVLMLTQGWRRYDISSLMKEEYITPVLPYETSQHLTGQVKDGYFKKEATGEASVILYMPENHYSDIVVSDKEGHFNFSGLEFPDSTLYVIQAMTKKGNSENIVLTMDEDTFPVVKQFHRFSSEEADKKRKAIAYQTKATEKYLKDHNIRTIELPNVDIPGKKRESVLAKKSFFEQLIVHEMGEEDISRKNPVNTYDLLNYLPGMMQYKYYFEKRSRGETEMITDNKGVAREIPPPCLIIINDQVMPNGYDINMIPASSIKSIGVISGSRMLIVGTDYSTFGQTRGVNLDMIPRKALVITTKYGEKIKKDNASLFNSVLSGYQKPEAFYAPKYLLSDTTRQPDLRTTLHWEPTVSFGEDLRAKVSFYTSDNATTYSVIIEGIMENGTVFTSRSCIEVE